MFIEIDKIINEKIMNAYMKGKQDLAQQIRDINSTTRYENYADNMQKILDICFKAIEDYRQFDMLGVLPNREEKK